MTAGPYITQQRLIPKLPKMTAQKTRNFSLLMQIESNLLKMKQ